MKTLSDDTETLIEHWDDPGDYPNAVAQSPLPSYDYVAGIEGEIVVEMRPAEFQKFLETVECESIEFWMLEVYGYDYPDAILSAKWQWEFCGGRRMRIVTFSVEEIEPDPSYRGSEPDWESLADLREEIRLED